jgi:hypothetical protein
LTVVLSDYSLSSSIPEPGGALSGFAGDDDHTIRQLILKYKHRFSLSVLVYDFATKIEKAARRSILQESRSM